MIADPSVTVYPLGIVLAGEPVPNAWLVGQEREYDGQGARLVWGRQPARIEFPRPEQVW